mmetsp:Transcript_31384/g.54457  ORF Transcript_31384/g.54457 Transcript_31384/m.54457 type:complete len:118 (+) Transcript_31384:3087-3440(+)
MGRGTNTNIFRRIAKNYLSRYQPEAATELVETEEQLMDCWKELDQSHLKCVRLEEKLNKLEEEQIKYTKYFRNLRLLQQVNSAIEPPEYQRDKKGFRQFVKKDAPWAPFAFRKDKLS